MVGNYLFCKANEDSERQMAVSSNHATKPLEADGGQKLYAGRAQDGHLNAVIRTSMNRTGP